MEEGEIVFSFHARAGTRERNNCDNKSKNIYIDLTLCQELSKHHCFVDSSVTPSLSYQVGSFFFFSFLKMEN